MWHKDDAKELQPAGRAFPRVHQQFIRKLPKIQYGGRNPPVLRLESQATICSADTWRTEFSSAPKQLQRLPGKP